MLKSPCLNYGLFWLNVKMKIEVRTSEKIRATYYGNKLCMRIRRLNEYFATEHGIRMSNVPLMA